MDKKSRDKYRPSFTLVQIDHIIALAKRSLGASDTATNQIDIDTSIEIISILVPLKSKIENGAMKAAYTIAPAKMGVEESLGMQIPDTEIEKNETEGHHSKEAYWLSCYLKWKEDITACSLDEIRAADEHRYLNELMSPEEVFRMESEANNG